MLLSFNQCRGNKTAKLAKNFCIWKHFCYIFIFQKAATNLSYWLLVFRYRITFGTVTVTDLDPEPDLDPDSIAGSGQSFRFVADLDSNSVSKYCVEKKFSRKTSNFSWVKELLHSFSWEMGVTVPEMSSVLTVYRYKKTDERFLRSMILFH